MVNDKLPIWFHKSALVVFQATTTRRRQRAWRRQLEFILDIRAAPLLCFDISYYILSGEYAGARGSFSASIKQIKELYLPLGSL